MKKAVKLAASSLALAVTTMGCTGSKHVRTAADFEADAPKGDEAAKLQHKAQILLQKGDSPAALEAMEQAVTLSPQDAGFRMGLAELYLRNGRFASAETTFSDVLALNPGDSRAGFYLALTKIAQGKTYAALAQLESMDSSVAPADIGLAFAIAGNSQRALALLEPAARDVGATGRVRQNLALAYALAGDWKKARITASQDVSPSEINKRMAQWAALADPTATNTRVATLLGVTPAEDSGQPTRLALAPAVPSQSAFSAFAEAAAPAGVDIPAPVAAGAPVAPAPVPVEPAPVAAVQPLAAPAEAVSVTENYATPKPVATAEDVQAAQALISSAPAASPVPATLTTAPIPAFASASRTKPALRAPTGGSAIGRFVVQIGAYRTTAQVEQAWSRAQQKFGLAAAHQPLSTTIQIPGKGTFYRLSVAGSNSRPEAIRLCQSIKGRGGACFVRTSAGDTPLLWVARESRRVRGRA